MSYFSYSKLFINPKFAIKKHEKHFLIDPYFFSKQLFIRTDSKQRRTDGGHEKIGFPGR